jgi:hypothetical protein
MACRYNYKFEFYSNKSIRKSIKHAQNIEDYSIVVKGFHSTITEDEVRFYFSLFGSIDEIYLARSYSKKLPKYKSLFLKIMRMDSSANNDSINRLATEIKQFYLKEAIQFSHDSLPVNRVYVVFESVDAKNDCILKHNKLKKSCFGNEMVPKEKDTNFNSKLKIKAAKHPSEIIWENLEYTKWEKKKARLIALLSTMILLVLSFVIVLEAKLQSNASLKPVVSICIVLLNLSIEWFISIASKYERFSSLTHKRLHVLTRIFLIVFVNTSIASFVAYERFPLEEKEINKAWIEDFGTSITLTMIFSIVSPHIFPFCIRFPYNRIKRKLFAKRFTVQIHLNRFFRGGPFDIDQCLSELLTTVFTCFLYSSIMPILNLVCLAALFVSYWCNKILLLRYYRKPPSYSAEINNRVLKFMPLAIVLHCFTSIWGFSSNEIFPSYIEFQGRFIQHQRSVLDRFSMPHSIANLILISLSLILMLYLVLVRTNIKSNKILAITDPVSLDLIRLESSALNSYNILHNPKYNYIISTLNSAAKRTTILKHSQPQSSFTNQEEIVQVPLAFKSSKDIVDDDHWLGYELPNLQKKYVSAATPLRLKSSK